MVVVLSTFTAIALYMGGFIYHVRQLRTGSFFNPLILTAIASVAVIAHTVATIGALRHSGGLDLSLLNVICLIALTINAMVFVSGFTTIQHSLYLILFPISALALALGYAIPSTKPVMLLSPDIQAHILLSILAYSFLAIAALQALLIGLQSWQLKHKRQNPLVTALPPLQSMESLLFEIIWVAEIFLTLSLISGFLFYDDFFAQKLLHKVVLSTLAWIFYAVLLIGRHVRGWRGHIATRLTWAGFICVLVGFIGSKFVLEFLIAQPPVIAL